VGECTAFVTTSHDLSVLFVVVLIFLLLLPSLLFTYRHTYTCLYQRTDIWSNAHETQGMNITISPTTEEKKNETHGACMQGNNAPMGRFGRLFHAEILEHSAASCASQSQSDHVVKAFVVLWGQLQRPQSL
jgi:hypothetical protein